MVVPKKLSLVFFLDYMIHKLEGHTQVFSISVYQNYTIQNLFWLNLEYKYLIPNLKRIFLITLFVNWILFK